MNLDARCNCGQSLGATGDHTKRLHTYGRKPSQAGGTPRHIEGRAVRPAKVVA